MRLLNGNVLCQVMEDTGKSAFILNSSKPYKELKVVKVPAEVENVKLGDIVFVMKKTGTDIEVEKDKYTVIHERDIILIL